MNPEDCDSQEHLTYREGKYQRKKLQKKKTFQRGTRIAFCGNGKGFE